MAGKLLNAICPNFEDHTPCPDGYIGWHDWAETMAKTHRQRKCGGCGRYTIWEPKARRKIPEAEIVRGEKRV